MSTSAPPPKPLTFPASTFRQIDPSSYLHRHLSASPPTRPSARSPHDFRAASLHTSSLSHTQGSAVVRIGDTAVVCGVRGEILPLTTGTGSKKGVFTVSVPTPRSEILTHSLLVPNLELGTGCTEDYHPGPPSDYAQSTAEKLRELLVEDAGLVDGSTLRIADDEGEIKAYWVLYVDVVCISLDGALFDCAWAAVVAALRATRLPAARWDADNEMVVCLPDQELYRPLDIRPESLVFAASFGVFEFTEEIEDGTAAKRWILSDPDEFEEGVCPEKVLVCVREDGKIVKLEKGGGNTDVMECIPECTKRARERCHELLKLVTDSS